MPQLFSRTTLAVVISAVVSDVPDAAYAAEPTAAKKTTVRIMTYNIHHGEGTDGKVDLERIAGVMKRAEPDLVAVQEVDKKTKRTGGVDQTAELARLTGMHGAFGKSLDYQGGEYGQAILSRNPLMKTEIHTLPGDPVREQRIAFTAGVTIHGRALRFGTTHLHHADARIRLQQAVTLNELFAKSDQLMILAGDLNAEPSSDPLKAVRDKWHVTPESKDQLTYPSPKPIKQIDYVLFRPADRIRVVECRVIAEEIASDHRPVLTVLELIAK